MRFSIAAIAIYATSAQAFRDTSPFLLFSSAPLHPKLQELNSVQLQSSKDLLDQTSWHLTSSPSALYYIITQPSLSFNDINIDTFPDLHRYLSASPVEGRLLVPDVQGLTDKSSGTLISSIEEYWRGTVKKELEIMTEREILGRDPTLKEDVESTLEEGKKALIVLELPELSKVREERDQQLKDNDARIGRLLGTIGKEKWYTVIYTTTPLNGTISKAILEEPSYEAEFTDSAHIDLKRDLKARMPDKVVQTDNRPLFEKYQFLTPGLFMGLLVGVIMFSILGVGLNAISSLQVSYGAFDKEMGPAAHRKQQ